MTPGVRGRAFADLGPARAGGCLGLLSTRIEVSLEFSQLR